VPFDHSGFIAVIEGPFFGLAPSFDAELVEKVGQKAKRVPQWLKSDFKGSDFGTAEGVLLTKSSWEWASACCFKEGSEEVQTHIPAATAVSGRCGRTGKQIPPLRCGMEKQGATSTVKML
jgi:hypothetical protein